MQNAQKLGYIALLILALSGYLMWKGIDSISQETLNDFVNIISASPSPSSAVLGEEKQATKSSSINNQTLFKVIKVVDGDTIEVEEASQSYKLRFIGIDTPETVDPRRPVGCFGKEASAETKRLLEGKLVRLEKDISETDKFGRLLRYVYLPLEDGTELFVDDYLVREGYARVSTYPPDVKFVERLKQAEIEARENNRGLWSKCQ
jgi:micrococcal nuclease